MLHISCSLLVRARTFGVVRPVPLRIRAADGPPTGSLGFTTVSGNAGQHVPTECRLQKPMIVHSYYTDVLRNCEIFNDALTSRGQSFQARLSRDLGAGPPGYARLKGRRRPPGTHTQRGSHAQRGTLARWGTHAHRARTPTGGASPLTSSNSIKYRARHCRPVHNK